jgi:alcohol dehydrogenase class IV
MRVNIRALQERAPDHTSLQRYAEIAEILTGKRGARAEEGVAWAEALALDLRVPGLGSYGITPAAFPILVEKAAVASSMQGNSLSLAPEELREILDRAL